VNPPRQVAGERFEVLPEHFQLLQVFAEQFLVVETSQRALKAHPVQCMENPHDFVLMPLYKRIKGAVGGGRRL
jgi:hypothetical protein